MLLKGFICSVPFFCGTSIFSYRVAISVHSSRIRWFVDQNRTKIEWLLSIPRLPGLKLPRIEHRRSLSRSPIEHGLYPLPNHQDSLLVTFRALTFVEARSNSLPYPSQHPYRTPYYALYWPKDCRACRSRWTCLLDYLFKELVENLNPSWSWNKSAFAFLHTFSPPPQSFFQRTSMF